MHTHDNVKYTHKSLSNNTPKDNNVYINDEPISKMHESKHSIALKKYTNKHTVTHTHTHTHKNAFDSAIIAEAWQE